MENTAQTVSTAQVNMQIDFTIMQFKMNLLALAKDIVKDKLVDENIFDTYLDLREEVLGIPNPRNIKKL